ncbi:MAG TPA: GNAT family N-acetyltransferase [Bacteroidales bacterium]|nr:GNAT family N-acetyltransferase [Bacteroidales bacterium]
MTGIVYRVLSEEFVRERLQDLILISRDIPHENWEEQQYLISLPGKWRLSRVCFSEETLLGYIIASEKEPGRVHIHKFVVNPSFRGKGTGRQMLTDFINSLGEEFFRVTLKVYNDNQPAVRFYISQGFVISGESEGLLQMEMKVNR